MWLSALAAQNFRCLEKYSIEPHPRLNLFVGANAAGKTSLLESTFVLGRARSFRGSSSGELAGPAGKHWGVRGRLQSADDGTPGSAMLMRWQNGQTSIRIDSHEAKRTELVERLPIQVIDPAQHRLLEDGPGYRRRYLDWGVFHVEHRFLNVWRTYERALRQRNQALRQSTSDRLVRAWDNDLINSAVQVAELRNAYLERLRPILNHHVGRLLGIERWTVELQQGWRRELGYAEALDAGRDRDRRMRQTVEGPHRAELRIRFGEHSVRNHVSRGQQKMLIAALVLAQAELIRIERGASPILLIDDLPAELGSEFQTRLVDVLKTYEGQLFITALQIDPGLRALLGGTMFHVEQGQIRTQDD